MAVMLYWVFVLVHVVSADVENSGKEKRILLNDPDIVQQVMLLKQEMEQLKNRLSASETESAAMKQEIVRLNNSLIKSEAKLNSINDMKQLIDGLNTKIATRPGAVYIRWGRTACSGHGTELVYSGYTAGQGYADANVRGGPSNYLCLPQDPELTNRSISTSSHLYGTEYEENYLRSNALNEDAPCAVCQSLNRTSSIMIPGRKTCYPGWTAEYNGFLASDYVDHSASSFICLDKDIEYVPGGLENKNGRLLYLTTTKCGSLLCPPYMNDQLVNCVVCSK